MGSHDSFLDRFADSIEDFEHLMTRNDLLEELGSITRLMRSRDAAADKYIRPIVHD